MSASKYDMIVVGGGPGGSAAAWHAARQGARVLLVDKATYPREKVCGDGITPRSVRMLHRMGLGDFSERYHKVTTLRVIGNSAVVERPWPEREDFPSHGLVIPRTDLDHALVDAAASAGVEVREATRCTSAIVEDGSVRGVEVQADAGTERLFAPLVVAADGASSKVARSVGLTPRMNHPLGLAFRAQVPTSRPMEDVLESRLAIRDGRRLIPGYGWIFPMQDGLCNIGVGFCTTYADWRKLNANRVMTAFLSGLPREWGLPTFEEMQASNAFKGWRLPVGFAVWPPWRPGLLLVGDAAGTAKPFSGSGISRALESGRIAAECGVQALAAGAPHDLHEYGVQLNSAWGASYRLANTCLRLAGRYPIVMRAVLAGMPFKKLQDLGFKLLGDAYQRDGGNSTDLLARVLLRTAGRDPSEGRRGPFAAEEHIEARSEAS